MSRWGAAWGSVILIVMVSLVKSGRHRPGWQHLSWVLEEQKCSCAVILLMMWSPQSLTAKRPNSHAFCLLYPDFPATHMHVELCDWLKFPEVTSSGHFNYLSAERSWLKTFIPDETLEEVSISFPAQLSGQAVMPICVNTVK